MTDKQQQDESSTGHHADAHGSTPLDDAAVEQVSGGGLIRPSDVCTRSTNCKATSHYELCPLAGGPPIN
jgi:hypothetical protein